VTRAGAPTGVAGGTCTGRPGCDADNQRVHNDRAVTVANFRQSAATPVLVPVAPSNLTANPESATEIVLNWNDNSTNETGFKIESCQDTDCTNFVQIATVGADVTTFRDIELNADTTYLYRLRASNATGDSESSNTVSATTFNINEDNRQ
jgi:hypothetical protein